jgi:phage terminase large subunit-like protein
VEQLAIERRTVTGRYLTYYPDTGELRRELYKKHLEFFRAGTVHRERLFLAANRTGKTEGVSAYETTLHLTGKYPAWWQGKRFSKPIIAWCANDTGKDTRDILQYKLLGRLSRGDGARAESIGLGTGMIPAEAIRSTRQKQGTPNAIETAWIRHYAAGRDQQGKPIWVVDGTSTLVFKSYEQGRKTFQGTEIDLIALDEEPPLDVYTECLTRTMATATFEGGLIILTFTPLEGWTEVVDQFLDEQKREHSGRFYVLAGWDDAPHLGGAEKADMLRRYPEYQRDARSKGVPQLGSGAIYQIGESEIREDPFKIPEHWPRAFGLDVGWNRTACIWAAHDRDSGRIHIYDEHYFAHSDVGENARAIRGRGDWIPGVIDPAARGRSVVDGQQCLQNYIDAGLDVEAAIASREAGIQLVRDWMLAGNLKVFASCANFWKEYRLYRRDEKGQVVKQSDHLMDALRYLMVSGRDRMKTKPVKKPDIGSGYRPPGGFEGSWLA